MRFWTATVGCCLWTTTTLAGIIEYNATTDFSTVSNPNGVWSYRFSNDATRDGNYDLLTQVAPLGPGGSLVWHADAGAATAQRPYVGVNTDNAGLGSWATGELAVHPGQSGGGTNSGLGVLSWLSPGTGTADIDFVLSLGLAGDVQWFLEKNDGSMTLDSGNLAGMSDSDSIALSGISVIAGDRLNLVVDSVGDPGSDLVRLSTATITLSQVPEPSSLALLAIAGSLLATRRKRSDTTELLAQKRLNPELRWGLRERLNTMA